ncbi:helix-turn-helix domain-containing protein [Pedobacter sp. PLR]|uniref:helix-turn-helix domain-containing protein n=1 Tax=Pedobacter sp. PLR TaxID=2994465 RepID=UPI002246915B|nr:helix-turn-helix domain-containing protein [Pedobacter sp. PLR]MCX2451519.1 helix-turn-helix domain-containing protein [Pedobacter sp. PLR]
MIEIFNDIRKLYQFKPPCSDLAKDIEFYSETSLTATAHYIKSENFTVKLFPSYTPTIWINLGSPYWLKNGSTTQRIGQHADILVLRNQVVERNNLPSDNIFTVKFHPGGFESVFGFSQHKIGDQVVPLSDLIPIPFLNRLKSSGNFADRVNLLQDFFLEKQKGRKELQHIKVIRQAIHAFDTLKPGESNSFIASNLCLTDKTFYRHFTEAVGANPKTYMMVNRARKALTSYILNPKAFSAYQHGYYDPGHFYKDILKFTGQKLSAFK